MQIMLFRSFQLKFAPWTRGFATKVSLNNKIDVIPMAYASYESTNSEEKHLPLIIMHGLFGSKGNWNSLCKGYHQRTQRKIISVDSRNHGDSPHSSQHSYANLAEDIRSFMEMFRIKKASLLGHSMGGRAMMYFALKYPDMVEKLIVADISPVNTSASLHTMPTLFDYLMQIKMPKEGPISSARAVVDQQLSQKIPDKGLRTFLLTNLIQKGDGSYAWRINVKVLISNFNLIATFPETDELTFEGPTLFLGGGASDYIKKTDHPEILKLFPNATFKYIDGVGHWLHSENPTEFLKLTVDFLQNEPESN